MDFWASVEIWGNLRFKQIEHYQSSIFGFVFLIFVFCMYFQWIFKNHSLLTILQWTNQQTKRFCRFSAGTTPKDSNSSTLGTRVLVFEGCYCLGGRKPLPGLGDFLALSYFQFILSALCLRLKRWSLSFLPGLPSPTTIMDSSFGTIS